jgi:Ca-activated chloride channel homolog
MAGIEFQYPFLLLLIPLVMGLAYFIWRKENTNPTKIGYSSIKNAPVFKTWKTRLYYLPELLKVASIICLIVVVSRPRRALVNDMVKGEGIDIVMTLDISSSMLTQDFKPDRFTVSKELAQDFVNRRKSDRIGLVVFSGESFTQCPITIDHEILNSFINAQQVGYLEDGTAIGMGLATAVNRIKNSDGKSKIIILLTDGVNNKGYIDPLYAADLAKELGIKVYTIGVGSDEYAPGPVAKGFNGEFIMDYTKGEIDEEILTQIAEKTNGKYYRAFSSRDLQEIYGKIDQLEKSSVEIDVLKRYKDLYRPWLILALALFTAGILLSITIFKRYM